MERDLLREAERLCGEREDAFDELPEATVLWLLLAACRERGWHPGQTRGVGAPEVTGLWHWSIGVPDADDLGAETVFDGPPNCVSPAGLVAAMLAAESAEGEVRGE